MDFEGSVLTRYDKASPFCQECWNSCNLLLQALRSSMWQIEHIFCWNFLGIFRVIMICYWHGNPNSMTHLFSAMYHFPLFNEGAFCCRQHDHALSCSVHRQHQKKSCIIFQCHHKNCLSIFSHEHTWLNFSMTLVGSLDSRLRAVRETE